MRKGAILIRGEFGIDPWQLGVEEYATLFTEAAWLQQHRTRQLARALGFASEEEQ